MEEAKAALMAILGLQVEWCLKYGYRYLSTAAFDGRRGCADTDPREPNYLNVSIGYGHETETPAAGTAGESG